MADEIPNEMIALAERLADASGAVLRRYFRQPMKIDDKEDSTPVTIADRGAEEAMRQVIASAAPDHGIIGEEQSSVRPDAHFVWVLDPIDGTKSFITGRPMFGTLIALVAGGTPILGIIDQPVINERWLGIKGRPTLFNGEPASVRQCPVLESAILNTTSPDLFLPDELVAFRRLSQRTKHTLYGGDCYAYGLVATGFVDLVVETGLKSFDYCALVPVVEGAGGKMTDWNGAPLTLKSDGRVIAAGDSTLHRKALAVLAG